MSALKESDSKKWINALVALGAVILGYVSIAFFNQMGEWFELEAKVPSFNLVSQALGIAVGLGGFLAILKRGDSSQYLSEVYNELTKVIWPDKESTGKLTVSIVIGVLLAALFLGLVDYGIKNLLNLLY